MSDEPGESREWRFYVGDMLQFAEKALSYTEGLDQAAFVADTRTYDATLRNIELIGEAATHIPAEVQKGTPRRPLARDCRSSQPPGSRISAYQR